MPGIKSILHFIDMLSMDEKPDLPLFKKALAEIATDYHMSRLFFDVSSKADFSEYDRTVIADAPDTAEYGDILHYTFRMEDDCYFAITIYAEKGHAYPDGITGELRAISNIAFYNYGRIKFQELVQHASMTHYLTGLPNSGGFLKRVAEIYDSGKISNYDSYYFNIKSFGSISKRYGSKQGDDMICQYAHAISAFSNKEELVAHVSEDNFVAIIKKSHYSAFITMLSEVAVHAVKDGTEHEIKLSATIGVLHIDKELDDISEVISLPSIAMNSAKNVLHQTVCHVSDELLYQVSEQKRVLERFPGAMRNNEFMVYYQPKVDSRTNTLVGAEALVRWVHKEEMIRPGAFIPVLEREGAISALDLYVLEHACADIREWCDNGITPVPISVNVSRKDLEAHTLPYRIADIIDRYGIERKYIQIEVTETMDETEHGIMTIFLDKLYEMGISTAIDDFGSGYSSLSTLRNFKINTLKIDRSFINNDVISKNDEIILSDIIHMANALNVEVITEGVERPDQLEFINKVGCFLIQGYYYDRPLPLNTFVKRLKSPVYDMSERENDDLV
jgi:diguanylate cyclase (GGDEF)-like protein